MRKLLSINVEDIEAVRFHCGGCSHEHLVIIGSPKPRAPAYCPSCNRPWDSASLSDILPQMLLLHSLQQMLPETDPATRISFEVCIEDTDG